MEGGDVGREMEGGTFVPEVKSFNFVYCTPM
jgi:hypothetical protein